ncbi:MAG TPA: hypothetical protein VM912_03325 [Terriglobales bacterium]|nr:hypothetical protein [Terriglobales bacterium]
MPTKHFAKTPFTLATALLVCLCAAQNLHAQGHCTSIGGTVMTNLGAVDNFTTLGVAHGGLEGAVAATIISVVPGPRDTILFTVQHHFVTQDGDNILVDPATATTKLVAPGLYAILDYPVQIKGGTGKFAGAKGEFNNIGAVELNSDGVTGKTVFRYSGHVCFAMPESHD